MKETIQQSPRVAATMLHRCARSLAGQIFIFSGNKEVSFEIYVRETLLSPLHSLRVALPQLSTAFSYHAASLYVLFETRLLPPPLVACIPFGKARLTFDKLNQFRTGCIRNAT